MQTLGEASAVLVTAAQAGSHASCRRPRAYLRRGPRLQVVREQAAEHADQAARDRVAIQLLRGAQARSSSYQRSANTHAAAALSVAWR